MSANRMMFFNIEFSPIPKKLFQLNVFPLSYSRFLAFPIIELMALWKDDSDDNDDADDDVSATWWSFYSSVSAIQRKISSLPFHISSAIVLRDAIFHIYILNVFAGGVLRIWCCKHDWII